MLVFRLGSSPDRRTAVELSVHRDCIPLVSRFRLTPTPEQEVMLLGQCAHARYVWNVALEQWSMWSVGRRCSPPRFVEQSRQLTEARADNAWLRAGSPGGGAAVGRGRVMLSVPLVRRYPVNLPRAGRQQG